MNDSDFPERRAPVHLPIIDMGNRTNIVFVTVCSHGRAPILANAEMHALIREAWATRHEWKVGRYIILPDHVHYFSSPIGLEHPPLVRWMSGWKAYVSRRYSLPKGQLLWQRSFWDRQLRSGDSYSAKWEYVRNNPVRHGLVATPDSWSYQGEMIQLRWHDA